MRAKSTKKMAVIPLRRTCGIQKMIAGVTTTLADKIARASLERAIGKLKMPQRTCQFGSI
jgi:hypothetical protein